MQEDLEKSQKSSMALELRFAGSRNGPGEVLAFDGEMQLGDLFRRQSVVLLAASGIVNVQRHIPP
jgi:hypothetical protein